MEYITWTYRDVTNFLEEKGFEFNEQLANSQSWVKLQPNGEPDTFVEVPYNTGFYSPKALKKMIRQSGIPESEWINWRRSNY